MPTFKVMAERTTRDFYRINGTFVANSSPGL